MDMLGRLREEIGGIRLGVAKRAREGIDDHTSLLMATGASELAGT